MEYITKASKINVGDVIQHPNKFWPRKKVLEINNVGLGIITFIIPSSVKPNEHTLVTFGETSDVIVHIDV